MENSFAPLLGTFGYDIKWPLGADEAPILALSNLTDAALAKLTSRFASRQAVPLKQSPSNIALEYALPLPDGSGDRLFRFDVEMRIAAVDPAGPHRQIEVQPRLFCEVVKRAAGVYQNDDNNDLRLLLNEIRQVLAEIGPRPVGIVRREGTAIAEFGTSVPTPSTVDLSVAMTQQAKRALAALKARFADRGGVPVQQPDNVILLQYSMPVPGDVGERLLAFDIAIRARSPSGSADSSPAIVPRIFGESLRIKNLNGSALAFVDDEGDALRRVLSEIESTLARLA